MHPSRLRLAIAQDSSLCVQWRRHPGEWVAERNLQEAAIESALPNLLPVQAIERCHCILAVRKADTACGHTIRSVASCSVNGVATAPVANSGATTSQDRRRQDCWPLKSTSVRQPRASAVATELRERRKLDRDYYINGTDRDKVLRLQQSPRGRVSKVFVAVDVEKWGAYTPPLRG